MSDHDEKIPFFSHQKIETNSFLMIVLIVLVVSVAGFVEIVPLFFQKSTTQPLTRANDPNVLQDVKPYEPLQLVGRDIYQREGCYGCHSQMIRPFYAETLRYGHYSVAGESVYDHPFQWGSKRTGPDLARVGGKYNDDWHRVHLNNPRDLVPESNMPAYSWLEGAKIDDYPIAAHMTALRRVGVPYTDAQIAGASAELKGKTEMDAVVAYLQGLGRALR
jgi:cytochrome c oxidase cbb3-type subunit 2